MNRLLVTLILVLVLVASFVTMAKAHADGTTNPSTSAADSGSVQLIDPTAQTSPPPVKKKKTPGRQVRGSQATSDADKQVPDVPTAGGPEIKETLKFTMGDKKARELHATFTPSKDDPAYGDVVGVIKCDECKSEFQIGAHHVAVADLEKTAKDLITQLGGSLAGDDAKSDKITLAKNKAEKEKSRLRELLCKRDDNDDSKRMTVKERVTCLLDHDAGINEDDDTAAADHDRIAEALLAIYKPIRTNYANMSVGAQKRADELIDLLNDSGVDGKRTLALVDASILRDALVPDQNAFQQATLMYDQAIATKSLPMFQAAMNQLVALQRNGTAITDAQNRMLTSEKSYINAAAEDGDFIVPKSDVNIFNALSTSRRGDAITNLEQSIAVKTSNKVTAATATALATASTDPYINTLNTAYANAAATSSTSTGTLNLGTPAALTAFVARDTGLCSDVICEPRVTDLSHPYGALTSWGEPTLTLGSTTGALRQGIVSPTVASGATGLLNANYTTTNGIIQIPTVNNVSTTAGVLNTTTANTQMLNLRGTGGGRGGMLLQ